MSGPNDVNNSTNQTSYSSYHEESRYHKNDLERCAEDVVYVCKWFFKYFVLKPVEKTGEALNKIADKISGEKD